jgi:hypothetical protein
VKPNFFAFKLIHTATLRSQYETSKYFFKFIFSTPFVPLGAKIKIYAYFIIFFLFDGYIKPYYNYCWDIGACPVAVYYITAARPV